MKKNIFAIYCYLMIIIFTVMLALAFAETIMNFIEVVSPEFSMTEYQIRKYGNNDNYREAFKDIIQFDSEESLTKHRIEARKLAVESSRHGALRDFVKNFSRFLIFIVIVIIHIYILKRTKLTLNNY